MIYQPAPVFDFRAAIGEGVILAALTAVEDFIAGANKPWAYYLGVGVGGSAAATGIPGAAATVYVICESVDVYLLHSPQGSLANVYLNGLAASAIDTSLGPFGWVKHTIDALGSVKTRIDLINGDPGSQNTSGISWLGISQIQTNNGTAYERNLSAMANGIVTFQITDDGGGVKTLPVVFPLGTLTLAQIQAMAADWAVKVDAAVDGKVTGISTTIDIDIPNGLKGSPVSKCDVEKGALLTFDASGTPYAYSVFVPSFKSANFVGDVVDQTPQEVTDLITYFISGHAAGGATVQPSDKYGNDLTALKKAVKKFRK